MPSDSDRIANDVAAIRDTLSGIGLDDSAHGVAADRVRQALSQHGRDLDMIAEAARAVAKATADHQLQIAQRDVETPTDDQVRAAQEAVILASTDGTPQDLDAATSHLADLLAEKKAAQDKFEHGQKQSAADLHDATSDLPDDPAAAPFGGLSPLNAMLGALKALQPGEGVPTAPAAPIGAPSALAGATSPDGQLADLIDSLQADNSDHRSRALTDPNLQPGAGQTHVSSDQSLQMPTLPNAQTGADISGRPANPFTVTPAANEGPTSGAPVGAPMAPPMAPMGARGAPAKGKNAETIIRRDLDFTGADIDRDVATSGVIGRGEGSR